MNVVVQKQIDEHMLVERDTTVQGALTAGATVRTGATLLVQGSFSGPLTVDTGATIIVQGSFTGDIARNDGTVALYGQVSLRLRPGLGRVVVGVESLLDGNMRLNADASVTPIGPSRTVNLNVDADRICLYDENRNEFIPLTLP